MNDLIAFQEIKTVPAKIEFDFEAAKLQLEAKLEPFKNVVTEDNIAQAKKEKAEINKMKAAIKDAFKIAEAEATAEVREAKVKINELCNLCYDGYDHLNDQIIKFESVVKEKCLGFLNDELNDCWEGLRVEPEFRKGIVDYLASLTNCNNAGFPTKKAKEMVKQIAMNDLAIQNLINMRLMQLENVGLKAGVTGLKRVHVEGFLFLDDETYERRLAELIKEEIDREKEMKNKIFGEVELSYEAKINKAILDNIPDAGEQPVNHSANFETLPVHPEKILYTITAVFEVSVAPSISPDFISDNAIKQMKDAGFKNLKSIEVIKVG